MHQQLLPIALPPVHHETLGSYLARLADANRLKPSTLPALLSEARHLQRDGDHTRHWHPHAIDDLAALTGRPATTLLHALPALREHPNPPQAITETTEHRIRPACRDCMAARGIHGLVIQRAAHHDHVCLRHRRWLPAGDQYRLDALPEVMRANIRHRRLARRADAPYTGQPVHLAAQHKIRE